MALDDEGEAIDPLVNDLLGRALEHVLATEPHDWPQVLREWNDFTATDIDAIVAQFDDDDLRDLAAQLLRRLTALRRLELLEEAFPTLRYSEN